MTAAAKHSQAMHFQARAGEKVRNPVLQRALQKAKPLFVGKRAKGIAGLADDDLDFEALRTACEGIRNRTLADLDVWLIHYNTERPHLGYRNMGRRPVETVMSCVSQEG